MRAVQIIVIYSLSIGLYAIYTSELILRWEKCVMLRGIDSVYKGYTI